MKDKSIISAVFAAILGLSGLISSAAEWQWSVPVESMINGETDKPPRAFLWIPPGCKKVRAVVVGQHNMEEEPILEHPKFRAALAEIGFAEVWITPSIDLGFNAKKGAGIHFEAMSKALAMESGYSELETAPIIPIGHSASSGFPWAFAAWNPARTLAVMSVSGSFPYYKSAAVPDVPVPGLVTLGDYEGASRKLAEAYSLRSSRPRLPLSAIGEMGGGHFEASDRKVEYLALYLKKVAKYRLSSDGKILTLDPSTQGWLVDRWRQDDPPKAPAAPVGKYDGDTKEAFWYFDEELALTTEKFQSFQRGKKAQLLGYVQDGKVVEQNPNLHAQVRLRFMPLEDGISFKLSGTFLDTVPQGRPEWWSGLPKGSTIAHGDGPITITRICGPIVQTGPDTWKIQFYRMGMDNKKRSNEIWLSASHPGDDVYKRSVQQSVMNIPIRNNEGKEQHITFPSIPDQAAGPRSLKLNAKSDADVPVCFYVREGPAEIEGDKLKISELPPRSRMPVKVTVVAWQYGRSSGSKLKTAEPVERTFKIGTGPDINLAPVWAKAKEAILALEAAEAENAAKAVRAAETAPNTISFNICKDVEMRPSDLAGAESRVGNWNNIKDLQKGTSVTLGKVLDKSGAVVPGMKVAMKGGNGARSFDGWGEINDEMMFRGLYDQFDGEPTTIEITGVPYAKYDVYFYRGDDGEQRAGKFKIGDVERVIKGGRGNPCADGTEYAEGFNFTKFENITGAVLKASFTATFAGDKAQRNKVVGFQIVERK